MSINYLLVILIGLSAGIVSLVLLRKLALTYNILINKGTPLTGGISMGLSFIIACLSFFLFNGFSKQVIGITLSSLIMLIFGIIDDWRELSVPAKFFVQIIATILLILSGVRTNIAYIGVIPNIIITFVWVLGITNAFNLLDIMDGLAAGIAIIVSLSFFAISLLNADSGTIVLTLALASVVLSFLIFNFPPARIYMGNSGSHFLGFVLAAVAMIVSYASLETKIALISPLFILGFPIFDTAFLILMRMSKKKLPFNKSNDHLALRLLALGYSKRRVLLTIVSLGAFFSLCGVTIARVSRPLDAFIIVLVVLMSIFLTGRVSKVAVHD